MLGVIESN